MGSFRLHFGRIFVPKSPIWRPETSKIASERPLEHNFNSHELLGSVPGRPGGRGDVSWRPSRPRGETTDFQENPAGSRVPALVARRSPFWLQFGAISDPKSVMWRPKSSKIDSRRPLEHNVDFSLCSVIFARSPRRQGERRLTYVGVRIGLEAKPLIFKKTLLGVESQRYENTSSLVYLPTFCDVSGAA